MNRRNLLGMLSCLPFISLFKITDKEIKQEKLRDIYKVDSRGNIIAKIRMKHIKKDDIITIIDGDQCLLDCKLAKSDRFFSKKYNSWSCIFDKEDVNSAFSRIY